MVVWLLGWLSLQIPEFQTFFLANKVFHLKIYFKIQDGKCWSNLSPVWTMCLVDPGHFCPTTTKLLIMHIISQIFLYMDTVSMLQGHMDTASMGLSLRVNIHNCGWLFNDCLHSSHTKHCPCQHLTVSVVVFGKLHWVTQSSKHMSRSIKDTVQKCSGYSNQVGLLHPVPTVLWSLHLRFWAYQPCLAI